MKASLYSVLAALMAVTSLSVSGFVMAEGWAGNIGNNLNELSLASNTGVDFGHPHGPELCATGSHGSCVFAFDWSAGIGEYDRKSVEDKFCHDPFDLWRNGLSQDHFVLDLGRVFENQSEADAPSDAVYGWRGGKTTPKRSAIARQIGRPDSLDELVRRLLGAIRELSPYDMGVESPTVHSMPLDELHLRFCGRPCTIRAAYVPGEGLYMDEIMRPLSNQYDQSILFHELVHHVQEAASSHDYDDECQRWRKREFEAYALQNRFLFALDSPARALWPGKLCAQAKSTKAVPEVWFGWYSGRKNP